MPRIAMAIGVIEMKTGRFIATSDSVIVRASVLLPAAFSSSTRSPSARPLVISTADMPRSPAWTVRSSKPFSVATRTASPSPR